MQPFKISWEYPFKAPAKKVHIHFFCTALCKFENYDSAGRFSIKICINVFNLWLKRFSLWSEKLRNKLIFAKLLAFLLQIFSQHFRFSSTHSKHFDSKPLFTAYCKQIFFVNEHFLLLLSLIRIVSTIEWKFSFWQRCISLH